MVVGVVFVLMVVIRWFVCLVSDDEVMVGGSV